MKIRASGILLPVSCLPSPYGIGDLGPGAYRFVDFLAETKQHVWQILPLNPTAAEYGHSPYHSTSAFAFNPLLISPELLLEDGLLEKKDLKSVPDFPEDRMDYRKVGLFKTRLLDRAFKRFRQTDPPQVFIQFCMQQAHWLDDFSLFTALTSHFNGIGWNQWPRNIQNRSAKAIRSFETKLADGIARIKFFQYLFHIQWTQLKSYCNRNAVQIFGDIPIYIPYHSADTWADPGLFKLDKNKRPYVVSGVPPDYFSETGQLWGHPVYRWEAHQKRGFDWWIRRIAHNLALFDYIRIDHFRGMVAFWQVPAGEKTAINGKWIDVPVKELFDEIMRRFSCLPMIAEDLGYITPDVREIMHRYDIPGMRLLLFGFNENPSANPNAPHNIPKNCVVYTGTHDTNTVKGWFKEEADKTDRRRLFRYLGRNVSVNDLPRTLIRLAMMSPANLAITPMQDLLGLGAEARLNRPATADGNWLWRVTENQIAGAPKGELREMTEMYGRT